MSTMRSCQRHPAAAVIVPPRLKRGAKRHGRDRADEARPAPAADRRARPAWGWQRASGYNWRALVEADIGRYKRVIGDALRSRSEGRQTTEVAIAVASLNRMLELGRPGVRSPLIKVGCRGGWLRPSTDPCNKAPWEPKSTTSESRSTMVRVRSCPDSGT